MKILLIGYTKRDGYPGVFFNNVQRALDLIGVDYDTTSKIDQISEFQGYDLYFGVGDEFFRRRPDLVAVIKGMGGVTADFRTKMLPNKPKTWLKNFIQNKKYNTDYVFTHMRDKRKNCFYVGQGFDPNYLYPEHDEYFTVLVDHYMPRRKPEVQQILDQCKIFFDRGKKVRIWYHNHDGIVENLFVESKLQYKSIPFDELTSYYRKTHIFLPTHRETQGIVAAEIGHCGGLTLLKPWMYPKQTVKNIPHEFYTNEIKWPNKVDVDKNREFTMKHYSIESFAERMANAIEQIKIKEKINT